MKRRKNILSIVLMSLVSLVSVIPQLFEGSDAKADVYLFVDHQRYIENIAYDLVGIVSIIVLTYTIWMLMDRPWKAYAACFLAISILGIPLYVLFYSYYVSISMIPLLILMLFFTYKRQNVDEK